MSDTGEVSRTRFRRGAYRSAERSALTQRQFDAIKVATSHEWLLGGPMSALDPEAIALYAVSLLAGVRGAEALEERWRLVLATLYEVK